jgi:hypothetical protein
VGILVIAVLGWSFQITQSPDRKITQFVLFPVNSLFSCIGIAETRNPGGCFAHDRKNSLLFSLLSRFRTYFFALCSSDFGSDLLWGEA